MAGCSNEPPNKKPDAHSDAQFIPDRDVSPASIIATHTYTCADNRVIAVQYLGDGLSLLLHRPAHPQATHLRASRQGGLFFGPKIVLKLLGRSLILREGNRVRRCERD